MWYTDGMLIMVGWLRCLYSAPKKSFVSIYGLINVKVGFHGQNEMIGGRSGAGEMFKTNNTG